MDPTDLNFPRCTEYGDKNLRCWTFQILGYEHYPVHSQFQQCSREGPFHVLCVKRKISKCSLSFLKGICMNFVIFQNHAAAKITISFVISHAAVKITIGFVVFQNHGAGKITIFFAICAIPSVISSINCFYLLCLYLSSCILIQSMKHFQYSLFTQ